MHIFLNYRGSCAGPVGEQAEMSHFGKEQLDKVLESNLFSAWPG
jgi:hypothetical protein